jgi:hypothetical protein
MSRKKDARPVNGWANRSTWNAALWILNDERLYRAAREAFRDRSSISAKEAKEWADRAFAAFCGRLGETPDGLPLFDVKWSEIAKTLKEIA